MRISGTWMCGPIFHGPPGPAGRPEGWSNSAQGRPPACRDDALGERAHARPGALRGEARTRRRPRNRLQPRAVAALVCGALAGLDLWGRLPGALPQAIEYQPFRLPKPTGEWGGLLAARVPPATLAAVSHCHNRVARPSPPASGQFRVVGTPAFPYHLLRGPHLPAGRVSGRQGRESRSGDKR